MDRKNLLTQSRRVVLCAMLAAIMTALQAAMAPLPNMSRCRF